MGEVVPIDKSDAMPWPSLRQIRFTTNDDLIKAKTFDKKFEKAFADVVEIHYTTTLKTALKEFDGIGDLMLTAYAASKGTETGTLILQILQGLSSLINQSVGVISSTPMFTTKALKFVSMAVMMADKLNFEKAVEIISKTTDLADEMIVVADTLLSKAVNLVNLLDSALEQASRDVTKAAEGNQALQKQLAIEKAKQAANKAKMDSLLEDVKTAEKDLREAKKQLEQSRTDNLGKTFISGISSITKAVGNTFSLNPDKIKEIGSKKFWDTGVDSKTDPEVGAYLKALNYKYEVEEQIREVNASSAENISLLESALKNGDHTKMAEQATELAYKIMFQAKVIFEENKAYWVGVKDNLGKLKSDNDVVNKFEDWDFMDEDEDRSREFCDCYNSIVKAGTTWLFLGTDNMEAVEIMVSVKKDLDNVMRHLPDSKQAMIILKKQIDKQKGRISESAKKSEESTVKAKMLKEFTVG